MGIGYKINKPCESQEELDVYSQCAEWCNSNGATIEDKGEYYEVVEIPAYIPTVEEQIESLKAELSSYDYIGVKIAMGVATKEEYAEQIAYTQTLRAKINALSM